MKRRGFTLIELLVATTIFAIVISAAYSLFAAGRDVSARAEFRAGLFRTGRAALRALEDDLRGALMSGSAFDTGLIGTDRAWFDKLELVAVNAHTLAKDEKKESRRIDISKVTYWIEEEGVGSKRGLVRERLRALNPVSSSVRRDEDVEEVAAAVVGLDFRYYDSGWKESWDSTSLNKLPKAIEASIRVRGEFRGGEVLETFTTRFYLPVGAETPEKTP